MIQSTIAARAWPAASHGLAGLRRIATGLKGSVAQIRSGRQRRDASGELKASDDHVLADIGRTRVQLEYARYALPYDKRPRLRRHGVPS
jgi:uncharacterized protein YjiS (DUF1127 family)